MKEKIKFIRELAKSMNENKLDGVQYEENNFEIQIKKREKEKRPIVYGGQVANIQQTQASLPIKEEEVLEKKVENVNSQEASTEINGTKIESPMVGTFYIAPSPTSAPFIKEGDSVTEGQTLCIVEAMKLMNEIKSSVSGKVAKILVKDGEAIKKGQVLIIIE